MKKTKIMTAAIALCMAATMFAGCSTNETVGETAVATRIEGGQTQVSNLIDIVKDIFINDCV